MPVIWRVVGAYTRRNGNASGPVGQAGRFLLVYRAPGFRPRLAIYHANAKGTGCAIKMELRPASGATDGGIFCTFAAQKTVGNRLGPNPTFPTFDWDGGITVKLAFDDLTKVQQVFRMHRRSLLRREHRRRRPAGRASVCASASRSMATTVSGIVPRGGADGCVCSAF